MPLRQTMLQGLDGTLTFDVPDAGTIDSATADLWDTYGDQVVTSATATITQATDTEPARLSYTADGATVASQLGENLRILWTYSISGKTYRRNFTFDVVMAQIYPTLTSALRLASYYPLLEGRDFPGTKKQSDLIGQAWVDLLDRIRGYGKNPNRMIDPAPLEPAHAALAASYVAKNYRPGGQQSTDWQQWATDRAEESNRLLRTVMSNFPWYDATEDLKPTIDEEHTAMQNVRLSR